MADSARDAERPVALVAVEDLTRFTETFGDLADPDVMASAWRRRTGRAESELRRVIGLEPDQEEQQPATAEQSAPKREASPPSRPERPSQPEQSAEDTDSAWGERQDSDHDERLYGDRPPHWDSI